MGYKITYGKTGAMRTEVAANKKRDIRSTAAIWIIVVIIFALLGSTLKKEEQEVAFSALNNFAEDIKNGEGVADAVTAFCRDIIESANDK